MRRAILMFGVAAASLVVTAGAQTAPLPAISDMSCEQMQAEMTAAGQLMNQQMDPNLGADIQTMQEDSQRQMSQARNAVIGSGLICAVPGLGMACTVAMNAQTAGLAEQAEANRESRAAMVESMQQATTGIDMARMAALGERWEEQRCQGPTQ